MILLAEHCVRAITAKAGSLAHAFSVLLNMTLDPKHLVVPRGWHKGGDHQHRKDRCG